MTGANSFIGQSLAKNFFKKNYVIYGCCRRPESIHYSSNFTKIIPYSIIDIPLDLLPKKIDIFIHLEGASSVTKSFKNINDLKNYNFNVIEKIKMIISKLTDNIHFIFPSSSAVYGNNNKPVLEETYDPKPISPYGIYKAYFENHLINISSNNFVQCSIIRFFSLYGPLLRKQLIWEAYKKIISLESPIFHGTGKEVRDFLYISDVIDLIEHLINHAKGLTIVNGGTGIGTTTKNVTYAIKDLIRSNKEIIFNNINRLGDPISLIASTKRLRKIGFQSKVLFKDGLKDTILKYEDK